MNYKFLLKTFLTYKIQILELILKLLVNKPLKSSKIRVFGIVGINWISPQYFSLKLFNLFLKLAENNSMVNFWNCVWKFANFLDEGEIRWREV